MVRRTTLNLSAEYGPWSTVYDRFRSGATAGKAYSSRGNRTCMRRRRIKAVIPEKSDQAAVVSRDMLDTSVPPDA